MPALQATPKRFQCNVSANWKACDVLCPMTHASTRSGPEDQLFALCVNRIVCLSQTRHTFATACSCLKQLLLSEKKSGDEAVPCTRRLWGGSSRGCKAILIQRRCVATAPGFKSDCCAPQLAGESCSATDVMATCDGFCELRGWQAG